MTSTKARHFTNILSDREFYLQPVVPRKLNMFYFTIAKVYGKRVALDFLDGVPSAFTTVKHLCTPDILEIFQRYRAQCRAA